MEIHLRGVRDRKALTDAWPKDLTANIPNREVLEASRLGNNLLGHLENGGNPFKLPNPEVFPTFEPVVEVLIIR